MKRHLFIFLIGIWLPASQAGAVTVDAQVEGPLLTKQRVVAFVKENLTGSIAEVADIDQGGKHRLFIRVASKHIGPGSWFLYLAEIQLQRRITDVDSSRIYWASLRSAVLWGTVPTENEVRDALQSLLTDKVTGWQPD
ncbi:MAG: hypothetical protein GTO41_10855 [Burkholderiales bacterium]|nr:hypothetical protein [Burkholderiales bacterium]